MRNNFQIGLEEPRMCTLPMYETMKDRSVKRFSNCLVASALACQFLQFLFVVLCLPQSLTKGGLSFWHIFKKCSKSTFLFLNAGVFSSLCRNDMFFSLALSIAVISGFIFVFLLFAALCFMSLSLYGSSVSSNILRLGP